MDVTTDEKHRLSNPTIDHIRKESHLSITSFGLFLTINQFNWDVSFESRNLATIIATWARSKNPLPTIG